MTIFPKDSSVRQVVPAPIQGVVSGFQVDQETGAVTYLVVYTDSDGEGRQRYFAADQLEAAI